MHFAPLCTTSIPIIEAALLKCKNILVTDEKKRLPFLEAFLCLVSGHVTVDEGHDMGAGAARIRAEAAVGVACSDTLSCCPLYGRLEVGVCHGVDICERYAGLCSGLILVAPYVFLAKFPLVAY